MDFFKNLLLCLTHKNCNSIINLFLRSFDSKTNILAVILELERYLKHPVEKVSGNYIPIETLSDRQFSDRFNLSTVTQYFIHLDFKLPEECEVDEATAKNLGFSNVAALEKLQDSISYANLNSKEVLIEIKYHDYNKKKLVVCAYNRSSLKELLSNNQIKSTTSKSRFVNYDRRIPEHVIEGTVIIPKDLANIRNNYNNIQFTNDVED
jgi:hypothetical protein